MPMSSHQAIRTPIDCRGFTLVEIIVVLLIVGVTVSFVFPRLVQPQRLSDLTSHTGIISNIVRSVIEESAFRGRILGVFAEDNTITVQRLVDGEWVAYEEADAVYEYRVSPPFSVDVQTKALPVALSGFTRSPIVILPDGQVSPFELVISNREDGTKRLIRGDGLDIAIVE